MAFDVINTGTTANDGTGDPPRTAFTRINDNFNLAVEGAASSTDGTVVQFDGTTGKVVKASTKVTADLVTGPASATDGRVAVYDQTTGKLLKDGTKLESDLVVGPASATDGAVALFDQTTGKLLKDGPVPGAASGLATLDASSQLVQEREQRVHLKVRTSSVEAWDDFITNSAELNGRVSPSGATWSVLDEDGATFTGRWSVNNSQAQSTTDASRAAALLPVASVNGRLLQGTFSKSTASVAVLSFCVYNSAGDALFVTVSQNVTFTKRVSGASTTLQTISGSGILTGGASGHGTWSAGFAVSTPTIEPLTLAFVMEGYALRCSTTDAGARAIASSANKMGFSAIREIACHGVRIVKP